MNSNKFKNPFLSVGKAQALQAMTDNIKANFPHLCDDGAETVYVRLCIMRELACPDNIILDFNSIQPIYYSPN